MKQNSTRKIVFVFYAVLSAFVALFLWASGGIQLPGIKEGQVYDFDGSLQQQVPATGKIVVVTWNIAYAYGSGSSGEGYVPHSAKDMNSRLERIGEVIRDSGADIALLQEVDFNSHRSHHIDQLKGLSRISGLRYAAYAVSWRAGYIPFPYWPPKYHFGPMRSGGAVLSRYPIISDKITLYPKPKTNHWWRNMFYLFRYSQQVQIQYGEENICVINNHLEAYDKDNRAQEAYALAEIVRNIPKGKELVIIGGDMNTIPLEATMLYNYPDDKNGDYRDDNTMRILRGIEGFKEVVKDEDYRSNEAAFFTFPASAPNRRLDYLFVSKEAVVTDAKVIPIGELSDHLPVRTELRWDEFISKHRR